MPKEKPRVAAAFVLCFLLSSRATAHGDLHGQIEALSKLIASDPRNPALLLRRGELNRAHRDFRAALADFEKAARIDPGLDVDLKVGRTLFEDGRLKPARRHLDSYASRHQDQAEVFVVRARTLKSLGRHEPAVVDYDRAIALMEKPKPDLYLDRARVLALLGKPSVALDGLEEGMRRLGRGPALEFEALDQELTLNRFDQALARLERMAASAPRQETWLVRKADILAAAGRAQAAGIAYLEALRVIEALPAARRSDRATAELESLVRQSLSRVKRLARGESPVASQARDFSSDQGAGPTEYREYSEVRQRRAGGKDPLATWPDFHHGLLAEAKP